MVSEKQKQFVLYWMSRYPKESKMLIYTANKQYFDAYKKYLYYGREETPIKKNPFRIYNIVGLSYGFVTDIAYLKTKDGKKEVFVASTIYANNDGVLNDNKYDYETIGYPFLKYLGKTIVEKYKLIH